MAGIGEESGPDEKPSKIRWYGLWILSLATMITVGFGAYWLYTTLNIFGFVIVSSAIFAFLSLSISLVVVLSASSFSRTDDTPEEFGRRQ